MVNTVLHCWLSLHEVGKKSTSSRRTSFSVLFGFRKRTSVSGVQETAIPLTDKGTYCIRRKEALAGKFPAAGSF